jgi:hypothetical protein
VGSPRPRTLKLPSIEYPCDNIDLIDRTRSPADRQHVASSDPIVVDPRQVHCDAHPCRDSLDLGAELLQATDSDRIVAWHDSTAVPDGERTLRKGPSDNSPGTVRDERSVDPQTGNLCRSICWGLSERVTQHDLEPVHALATQRIDCHDRSACQRCPGNQAEHLGGDLIDARLANQRRLSDCNHSRGNSE